MNHSPLELLKWYMDAGADEATADMPEFFKVKVEQAVPQPASPPAPNVGTPVDIAVSAPVTVATSPSSQLIDPKSAAGEARLLADQATTRGQLETAVRAFNGLAIKKTATHTVFCDGNPNADIMLIGEAPGASEDAQGIPFCGKSGQLLDQMLASIGLNRTSCYITNVIFWRPPGNRRPTDEELEICKPFVEKHIALIKPKHLVMVGGTATSTLLDKTTGITKLRQKNHNYTNSYMDDTVPTHVLFHPSYLLRQPLQKKLAWEDLLKIKRQLT